MHFRIDGNGYGGGSHGGGGGHGGSGLSGGSVVDAVAGTVAGSALPSANAVTAADFGHGLHGPSRSRSSSSDPRHLTGEMINQMNALRKKDNATIAASLADCHRQQLQMQAIYERALRVSFFKSTIRKMFIYQIIYCKRLFIYI